MISFLNQSHGQLLNDREARQSSEQVQRRDHGATLEPATKRARLSTGCAGARSLPTAYDIAVSLTVNLHDFVLETQPRTCFWVILKRRSIARAWRCCNHCSTPVVPLEPATKTARLSTGCAGARSLPIVFNMAVTLTFNVQDFVLEAQPRAASG